MAKGENMVINGTYRGNGGRPTEKTRNLKRFAEQWAEFEDEEILEFGGDDAEYIAEILQLGEGSLDHYHEMANALEV